MMEPEVVVLRYSAISFLIYFLSLMEKAPKKTTEAERMRESPSNVSILFMALTILSIIFWEYFSIYSMIWSVLMCDISASSILFDSYLS